MATNDWDDEDDFDLEDQGSNNNGSSNGEDLVKKLRKGKAR